LPEPGRVPAKVSDGLRIVEELPGFARYVIPRR
jgi:hypothetical protein